MNFLKIKQEFPFKIIEIEHFWIPLSDGIKLAARMWIPQQCITSKNNFFIRQQKFKDNKNMENIDSNILKVPSILEYIPYGKRFETAYRDELNHPYYAGHGYACIRVDIRGCGESEGIFEDEYTEQEQKDVLEILQWIVSQYWSNGKVGMIGISWGGIISLQVSALQPPELKAVVTVCSTDNRYTDDVHFCGGCLLLENIMWSSEMLENCSRPPDPMLVGSKWQDIWLNRLRNIPLLLNIWMSHQTFDSYWKHGSVSENYNAIQCPIYAVGGWVDSYKNTVTRLLKNLRIPCKGLIGPWGHKYPHIANPGPTIGFLQETLRWWNVWLKNSDEELDESYSICNPQFYIWMQNSSPCEGRHINRQGRWIFSNDQFQLDTIPMKFYLDNNYGLTNNKNTIGIPVEYNHSSLQTVGRTSGHWCTYGGAEDIPGNQHEEDENSLTFNSEPLREKFEILGTAIFNVSLKSDKPIAFIVVRLCDVFPNGESTLVTYGILNLCHRYGHENVQYLEKDKIYNVKINLNDIAHSFQPCNIIRISISTSYWPTIWPAPEPFTLTIITGENTFIEFPQYNQKTSSCLSPSVFPINSISDKNKFLKSSNIQSHFSENINYFEIPETSSPLELISLRDKVYSKKIEINPETGEQIITWHDDNGIFVNTSINAEVETIYDTIFKILPHEPLSAFIQANHFFQVKRNNWKIITKGLTTLTSTKDQFIIYSKLETYEQDKLIFNKIWNFNIPRYYM